MPHGQRRTSIPESTNLAVVGRNWSDLSADDGAAIVVPSGNRMPTGEGRRTHGPTTAKRLFRHPGGRECA
jgi:hypothetical protein